MSAFKCLKKDQLAVNKYLREFRKNLESDCLPQCYNIRVEQINRVCDAQYNWGDRKPDYWVEDMRYGDDYYSGFTYYVLHFWDATNPWFDIVVAFKYSRNFGLTDAIYLKDYVYDEILSSNEKPKYFWNVVNEFAFQIEKLYKETNTTELQASAAQRDTLSLRRK